MIPILELIRLEESIDCGTFGVLRINKQVHCFTLEPPDLLNKRNISNIPPQQYICKEVLSPRFGLTYEIANVPDRTAILFHSGNTREHTEGCILLGRAVGLVGRKRGVVYSKQAFEGFMKAVNAHSELHLTIREEY